MRARIPYVIVGDVGFYQRAEIKDALAFLRLAETPDDRQSDEAFRRVINEPRRGFGAKAMEVLEADAAFRNVSLLRALDTAELPRNAAPPAYTSRRQSGALAPTILIQLRINCLFFSTPPAIAPCCVTARRKRPKTEWRTSPSSLPLPVPSIPRANSSTTPLSQQAVPMKTKPRECGS